MLILGLTGSIGMGKSAAAAILREHGIPVCDADAEVHQLYKTTAVAPIEDAFPGTTTSGGVDRGLLSRSLLADPAGFKRLEQIIHPLVRAAERAFLHAAEAENKSIAVLEIPLLFETGGDAIVDATAVVSAPPDVQRARVLARSGMTEEKFLHILSRQWPDDRKRAAASFIVDTGGTMQATAGQIDVMLAKLHSGAIPAQAFDRYWSKP